MLKHGNQATQIASFMEQVKQTTGVDFKDKLQHKISKLEKIKSDSDIYISAFVIFFFIAIYQVTGININNWWGIISPIMGDLSLFVVFVILLRLLSVTFRSKNIEYYEDFLLFLKESEIEKKIQN